MRNAHINEIHSNINYENICFHIYNHRELDYNSFVKAMTEELIIEDLELSLNELQELLCHSVYLKDRYFTEKFKKNFQFLFDIFSINNDVKMELLKTSKKWKKVLSNIFLETDQIQIHFMLANFVKAYLREYKIVYAMSKTLKLK